jgi:hypothetical protein
MLKYASKILPKYNVNYCSKFALPGRSVVDVFKHFQSEKSYYHGIKRCNSVWLCPLCSARISERRKIELFNIIQSHQDHSGTFSFVTLTIQHSITSDLSKLLQVITQCFTSLMSARNGSFLRTHFSIDYYVKSLEVTYSNLHGWHPHLHVVFFHSQQFSILDLRQYIFKRWKYLTQKKKVYVNDSALDVQQGYSKDVVHYISKWSISHEMTGSYKKKSNHSKTPWDILYEISINQNVNQNTLLFKTYAKSFSAKHQLHFSKGLKIKYSIPDLSDEEINNQNQKESNKLGELPIQLYQSLNYDQKSFYLLLCDYLPYEDAYNTIIELKKNDTPINESTQ